jgi:hypothetical protein
MRVRASLVSTRILTRCGTYLIRELTLSSRVARCGAAPSVGLFWTISQLQRGVAVAPLKFRNETEDQKCCDVVSGVGTPCLRNRL